MLAEPFDADYFIYVIPSTPLIASSNGITTLFLTVSALAPGYDAQTLIAGGAMSGYRSTGKVKTDNTPKITITMLMTIANKGRPIKVLIFTDLRVSNL